MYKYVKHLTLGNHRKFLCKTKNYISLLFCGRSEQTLLDQKFLHPSSIYDSLCLFNIFLKIKNNQQKTP